MFATGFEREEKQFRLRKRATGAGITIGIHSLILLCLLWYQLTPPDPPYKENEGGVTVNFGTSEVGSGEEQPFSLTPIDANFSAESPPPSESSSQESAPSENLVTQDMEEAPSLPSSPEPKPIQPVKPAVDESALFKPSTKPNNTNSSKPASNATADARPAVDENALFKPGAFGKPNNSRGDGTGGGQGDQGKPNGDPNSRNYEGDGTGFGTGSGNGLGDGNVQLSGRKLRYKPQVTDRSQATGKVIVTIKVDRNGKVVDAYFSQLGSTTSDPGLVKTSIEAARKYQFDENPAASELQTGKIIFIYKLN
jgi:protein TonB